jgi:hypothetical protein
MGKAAAAAGGYRFLERLATCAVGTCFFLFPLPPLVIEAYLIKLLLLPVEVYRGVRLFSRNQELDCISGCLMDILACELVVDRTGIIMELLA